MPPRLVLLGALSLALAVWACGRVPNPPPVGNPALLDAGVDSGTDAGEIDDDAGDDLGDTPDASFLPGPAHLSETGLYADFKTRTVAPDIIPFTPRFELWSDGAAKKRWLLLPSGKQIDTSDMDNWIFPVGTRAWKEFTRDGVLVETRMLWKAYDLPGLEGWFEMAYVWRDDGSDADATPAGLVNAKGTSHDVPTQQACNFCHQGVRDVLIGVSALQLSSATGDGTLSKLAKDGRLSHPPPAEFQPPGTGVVFDALSYLHANCGHCHSDGNQLALHRTLRLRLRVSDTDPLKAPVYTTAINAKTWHVLAGTSIAIVPGDPDHSQLYFRAGVRDAKTGSSNDGYQMPPICTRKVDTVGLQTLHDWIAAMPK